MRLPAMKVGQIGYVEVINTTNFGCFVEVGTERGIFMPHAEMRGRPQVGEKVMGSTLYKINLVVLHVILWMLMTKMRRRI